MPGKSEKKGAADREDGPASGSPDPGVEGVEPADAFGLTAVPKKRAITPLTTTLVIIFTLSGVALLGVTYLGTFKEYFEGEAILWIIRIGIIVMMGTLGMYFAVRERSHRRHADEIREKVLEANKRLSLLLDAGRELGSTLDLEQILEKVLGYAVVETQADMGAIYLWERDDDVLAMAVSRCVDEQRLMFKELPMGRGLMGEAASRREMVVVDDTGKMDERDNVFFGAATPGCQVVVPLLTREKFVGMLVMGIDEPHDYTDEEKRLIKGLAELAGLAIANAELYRIARRSLDALSRQRGVTGSVLDEMVAGVITADGNGRIDVFNREAQRLTGYTLGEMAQVKLKPEVSLEESPLGPLERGMLEVMKSPQTAKEGEALIMKRDRALLPVSFRVYPLMDGDEIEGAAAVFMEVGADAGEPSRKEGVDYQVLLRSLGARIERLYTHPLSRVIERVRVMGAEEWSQSKEDIVSTLEAGSAALLELLEDIENYLNCVTVREWDAPRENDFGEIASDVVADIMRSPEHEGTSVVVKLAGLPMAFGHERMTRAALEEVIENAVIAADNGGKKVEVTGREVAGYVRIEVRDNGPGVSDKTMEYMYLPFFTDREGRPGLGLATARRVMRRLGGRMGTEDPGDGALFFLEFPTRPEPAGEDGG